MEHLDVLGFGESSIDHVYVVGELPSGAASKVRITSTLTAAGGQVATAMAACAALGLKAAYLGPVGDDEDGRGILEALGARGVITERAIVRRAPTRRAIILVDRRTGDRNILWQRHEGLDVPPAELPACLVQGARLVHVDAVDEPAAIHLARQARAAGAIVTCDVDAVTPRTRELLAEVTHPVLAADVPRQLTGEADIEAALRALRREHPGLLCVTLGEQGAAALERDRFVRAPGVRVAAVDTTSAGDVFRAGFIYGVLQGWPVERTLAFANAAASVACTRAGAIASVPSLDDVRAAQLDSYGRPR